MTSDPIPGASLKPGDIFTFRHRSFDPQTVWLVYAHVKVIRPYTKAQLHIIGGGGELTEWWPSTYDQVNLWTSAK